MVNEYELRPTSAHGLLLGIIITKSLRFGSTPTDVVLFILDKPLIFILDEQGHGPLLPSGAHSQEVLSLLELFGDELFPAVSYPVLDHQGLADHIELVSLGMGVASVSFQKFQLLIDVELLKVGLRINRFLFIGREVRTHRGVLRSCGLGFGLLVGSVVE